MKEEFLRVRGAKQHNLKNISLDIPKYKLVVFTGLSGSGKSSLAFDTIYAEGQRRYVESLSSYARQFLGLMTKPDVESVEGLSPAISIDQKVTSHNPRSTVGTVTEIYDYLRLLFARVGHPHCPKCGREIQSQSAEQITDHLVEIITKKSLESGQARFLLLSPIVRDRKGEFKDLFLNLKKKGVSRVRIDGVVFDIQDDLTLIKTNKHSVDAILERLTFDKKRAKDEAEIKNLKSRLSQAVETALKLSDGLCILSEVLDKSLAFPESPKEFGDHLFSERFACPVDNISLPEIEPRIFSFNSPHGACPTCHGLGSMLRVDPSRIIAPELSLSEGAIIPFARALSQDTWFRRTVAEVLRERSVSLRTPYARLDETTQKALLYGTGDYLYRVRGLNQQGVETMITETFEGFIPLLERRYHETESEYVRSEVSSFMRPKTCPTCQGTRLKPEPLSVTIGKQNIHDVVSLPISQALRWIIELQTDLSPREKVISNLIVKEIATRLQFLSAVGLEYLTLARAAGSLAGGESQRIRLASQIGTGLTGVLYVLDEPTIGLHPKDNQKLISTLKSLRDLGNSVIVVEHDQETIESADWIVDFGPLAGKQGGAIVAQGSLNTITRSALSLTGKYLSGKKKVSVENPPSQNKRLDQSLTLVEASEHNLKHITVHFPLGKLITITGVSGSGKSTLLHDTLYHALATHFNPYHREKGGEYQQLLGTQFVNRVSLITQSPIGRTPRSNPVTYTKAFDYIREQFALTMEAKAKGFKAGRFSFNVKGGRCEVCQGGGSVKIAMQFLPDVFVPCDTCGGKRFNSETLSVTYKGKTIANVLNLTVSEALEFLKTNPAIQRKLQTLEQVGLGYIELGQPAPQLSGGEAQRIKLARELSVRSLGHTVYLLDEPTTGLHFADVEKLLHVLKALVTQDNTVIVIEHNLDVVRNSDWVIDLGPEGGDEGGEVVAVGTPRQITKVKKSYTGQFLAKHL